MDKNLRSQSPGKSYNINERAEQNSGQENLENTLSAQNRQQMFTREGDKIYSDELVKPPSPKLLEFRRAAGLVTGEQNDEPDDVETHRRKSSLPPEYTTNSQSMEIPPRRQYHTVRQSEEVSVQRRRSEGDATIFWKQKQLESYVSKLPELVERGNAIISFAEGVLSELWPEEASHSDTQQRSTSILGTLSNLWYGSSSDASNNASSDDAVYNGVAKAALKESITRALYESYKLFEMGREGVTLNELEKLMRDMKDFSKHCTHLNDLSIRARGTDPDEMV